MQEIGGRRPLHVLSRALLLACCLAGLLSARAAADVPVTITPLTNTISWTAATPPDPADTGKVTYFVVRSTGFTNPKLNSNPASVPSTNFKVTVTTFTVFDALTLSFGGKMVGTQCFIVRAQTVLSGMFDESVSPSCHSFLHYPGGGNGAGYFRADANGQQVGFNEQWFLSYYLDDDSLVKLWIYSATATFHYDSNGFAQADAGDYVVKKVVDFVPRSGEMADGSWKNTELWDSRDSTGVPVQNGIYYALMVASEPFVTNPNHIVYSLLGTIPVDLLRFTAFNTVGITPTGSLGQINYTLTGDATVRIVIAKAGARFTIDDFGDVQALDANGNIDESTKTVVTVLEFNRRSGTYSETWNGTNSAGVAVSSGIYSLGVSAMDAFGDQALNTSGNDGPQTATMPVDRTASQTAVDTTPPVVSSVTVGAVLISLTGGTTVAAFNTIIFGLNKAAGTGANLSLVSLTGPAGPIAGGAVSAAGSNVTYSTNVIQGSTGPWTVSITAKDTFGNASSLQSFSFAIPQVPPPTVTAVSVGGSAIALGGGSSASPFTVVAFTLSGVAGTGVNLSSASLFYNGTLVLDLGGAVSAAGSVVTVTLPAAASSTGTYTAKIIAIDAGGNAALAPFSVSFTIPTQSANTVVQTADAFRASVLPSPNPARNGNPMAVKFTLLAPASMEIDLYTLTGQRVYHQTQSYPAGTSAFNWALTNDAGSAVASGVYILRMTASTGSQVLKATKKVMVLK